MKTVLAASLALAALGASLPAEAQVRGSYRATCTDIRQRGPILEALCQDRFGELRPTRLDLRSCDYGDVSNRNGRLVCSGGRGERGGGYERGYDRGYAPGYRGRRFDPGVDADDVRDPMRDRRYD